MAYPAVTPTTTDEQAVDEAPTQVDTTPQVITLPGTGSFHGGNKPVEAPEAREARLGLLEADKRAQEAQNAINPLEARVETTKAEGKSKEAKEAERQAEERRQFEEANNWKMGELRAIHQGNVDRAQKFYDKLEADAAGAKYHDWWDSKSSGDRIKAHIAIGLGAFGNALAGGGNPALEMIQREIDRDERTQKEAIDRKYAQARAAAENLKGTREDREKAIHDAEEQYRMADIALGHRQEKQLKAIQDESLAQQLAAGVPLKQAQQNVVATTAGMARAEKIASNAQKLSGLATWQTSTSKHATVAKQPSKPPEILTDTLTGKDLPVDPRRTDARKHNAAVALLPNANGAIQILDSVLAKTKTGAEAPGILKFLPGKAGESAQKQTGVASEMTRFRSAYAAAKKESVGEKNAEELAKAIPDPPSALSGPGAFAAWRRQIEDTRKELYDIRNGLMGNAGVPPQYLHHSEAAKPGGGITRPEMIESVKGAVTGLRKLSPAELAGGSYVK